MKRKIRYIISFIVSIFIIFSFNVACVAAEKEDYIKKYKDSLYYMSKMMRCIPKTGDINLDYLCEMVMLNEGEVEFSEAYFKYASCDDIKGFAEQCIKRESESVSDMKIIIEKLKECSDKNEKIEDKYLKIYNDKLNEMINKFQKIEFTESIDINFLKFVSIHHEWVIDITSEFLQLSDNVEVKEIANKLNNDMKGDMKIINEII